MSAPKAEIKNTVNACQAFSLIAGSRTAWVPCVRQAEEGEKYCRRHGDAVAGVLLGEVVYGDDLEQGSLLNEGGSSSRVGTRAGD
jgi:hypothetical protein